jgi:26S proteasome regulatory subunit N1
MDYGEPIIRKSVPLAIGLVSVSNPQLPILDTLSKYSHDNDLAAALAQHYFCNGPRRCREPTT